MYSEYTVLELVCIYNIIKHEYMYVKGFKYYCLVLLHIFLLQYKEGILAIFFGLSVLSFHSHNQLTFIHISVSQTMNY